MAILINDVTPYARYTATAGQTLFTVPFEFFNESDLIVLVNDVVLTYSPTPADKTQYSVTGANQEGGGSITLGAPGASLNDDVVIYRAIPIARSANYPETGPMAIASLNTEQAKHIGIMQQLQREVSRALLLPLGEAGFELPAAADRASKVLAFDANGDLLAASAATHLAPLGAFGVTLVANATAADARSDLGINSAAELAAPAGSALVGFLQAGTGAVASTVQAELRNMAVTPQQFLAGGESISTDAGPAIRRALATGKPVRFPQATYVVDYDPASAFNDGGNTRYEWCISIPTGATLIFEDGATIQAKAGQKNWNRVIAAINVSNFRIFGELKVDANVSNIGTPNNEHMHGVYLFNATNFYIEAINSQNARADNVYLGGTDNSRGTSDGYIGRIVAKVAGRKNLVWQCLDNVNIGSAYLDNSSGGAAIYSGVADTTDGNCFDVEPDSFTGATRNSGTIGYLYTKGAGNDFTAGTTATQADNFVVNIGQWDCVIVPRSTVPWHTHYGMTLNIGTWTVTGITATAATAEFYYSCRLNADTVKITGTRTNVSTPFLIAAWNVTTPEIVIKHLDISGTGIGFENRDGFISIGYYRARTTGIAFWNRGTSGTAGIIADLVIDTLDMSDVGQPLGAGYGFLASMTTNQQSCRIGHIRFRDARTPKLNYVGYSGSGASAGVFLGTIDNNTTVPLIGYGGTDTFYRVAGGVGTSGDFVVTGTPEAKITAPIGSFARRTNGGAATSIYVKESGTGNTGWVAK